ncbi:MAG: toll/interleukin-1 receptor domain-containing protein [Hyphomonas sp.]
MADIFLSYSSANRADAEALAKKFTEVGFSVFFDRNSLVGGDIWSDVLDQELNKAAVVVGLWSKVSLGSE